MKDDRESILSRVRGALASLRSRAPLPNYDPDIVALHARVANRNMADVFAEQLQRAGGRAFADPVALAEYLRRGGWVRGYCDPVLWPSLAPHFAEGFTVELAFDRGRIDEYHFGISRAAGAIAETCTIILNDATTSSRLAALAPWVHVAVVERTVMHAHIANAIAALGSDPNVIWCTGPSKTADVEGILIEGVHGPGVQIALIV